MTLARRRVDLRPLPNDYVVDASDWALIQTNAESADKAIVTDLIGGGGIASGLDLTEQPSPNLTLQLSAGVAYDATGRRLNVDSTQTVDLATDSESAATSVTSGQERYVAVYLRFKRENADPATIDGSTVYRTQAEGFEVLVVSGSSAASGTATVPAAPSGNPILLGRVLRTNGQTAIRTNDVRLTSVPILHRAADLYDDAPARMFEVSTADPPGMTLVIAAGRANIDSTHYVYAGGTTGSFTAPVTHPRIDMIALDSTGSLVQIAGTEAASPVRPSTQGYMPIAFVTLAVGQTAITDANIADGRPWLQTQTARRRYHELTGASSQTQINLPFSYTVGAHALEVTVSGAVLAESQYVESNPTRVTLNSALSGGERVTVRALETSPLEAVTLEQVTDDLSGLLVGGEVAYEDRGASLRLYVEPIALAVIERRSYAMTAYNAALSSSTSNAWRYLYARVSAGVLGVAFSSSAPDASKTWLDDDTRTWRFLAAARTDSGGIPLMFHRAHGVTLYDRCALGASDLNVLTGGSANSWALVSLASLVPPHARHALVEIEVTTGSGTNAGVELRTYNASGAGVVSLTVEAISATTQTVRREVWMLCDALQRIEYERVSGYAGSVTLRVLGYRG